MNIKLKLLILSLNYIYINNNIYKSLAKKNSNIIINLEKYIKLFYELQIQKYVLTRFTFKMSH